MIIFSPDFTLGAIEVFQKGITLSNVVLRLSVRGHRFLGRKLYFESLPTVIVKIKER